MTPPSPCVSGFAPAGAPDSATSSELDTTIGEGDVVNEFDGVRLVVDGKSIEMVKGAEVDYRDTLQGAGFHINNPNVTRSCGCGNSFS